MTDSLEMLVNATAGATGGAVSKFVSYPLERVKSRLMAKQPSETFWSILQSVHATGWYVGLPIKVSKTVTQKFIYFYIYEGLCQLVRGTAGKAKISMLARLSIGYFAEVLGIPAFAPLETLVVQMQTGVGSETTWEVMQRLHRTGGLGAFYGAVDGYMMGAIQPAIVYTIYERVKTFLLSRKLRKLQKAQRPKSSKVDGEYSQQELQSVHMSPAMAFWLGALSRSIGLTIAHPLNLGRTMIQAQMTYPGTDKPVENVVRAMVMVFQREGVQGLFKGLFTDLTKGMLDAAVMMMVKESIHLAVRRFLHWIFGRKSSPKDGKKGDSDNNPKA